MKKVDCLKNVGVNVKADNAGEKKNILDGCKFCMKVDGFKCDKAEALFNEAKSLGSAEAAKNLEEIAKKRQDNALYGE